MISQENCQYPSISQESTHTHTRFQKATETDQKKLNLKGNIFSLKNGYSDKIDSQMY